MTRLSDRSLDERSDAGFTADSAEIIPASLSSSGLHKLSCNNESARMCARIIDALQASYRKVSINLNEEKPCPNPCAF